MKTKRRLKPSTILQRAFDSFQHGKLWVQGTLRDDETGEMCALGGIEEINTPRHNEAKKYLAEAISGKRPTARHAGGIISYWNDNGDTEWRHVTQRFHLAIWLAKRDGN